MANASPAYSLLRLISEINNTVFHSLIKRNKNSCNMMYMRHKCRMAFEFVFDSKQIYCFHNIVAVVWYTGLADSITSADNEN